MQSRAVVSVAANVQNPLDAFPHNFPDCELNIVACGRIKLATRRTILTCLTSPQQVGNKSL